MRISFLLVALSIALSQCLAAAAGSGFTIPLPAGPSSTEFFNGGAGDMYYTVGTGGRLFGVNLTSKQLQFTSAYPDGGSTPVITALHPFDVPGGLVIVDVGDMIALDGKGELLWVSASFTLPSDRKYSYTVINSTLFVASNTAQTFNAVNLLTGDIISTMTISNGDVFKDRAILTVTEEDSSGQADVSTLVEFSLPSLQQVWSISNVGAYIGSTDKYLLVENKTFAGEDTQVLVLDVKTKKVLRVLDAMNGIIADGFAPIIHKNILICELGVSTVRLAAFNIDTGVEMWQMFIGPAGQGTSSGAQVIGDSLVTIHHLTLSIMNLTSGQIVLTRGNVPYTSEHTVTPFGHNQFNVVNLQGYTTWNSKGQLVGTNEMAPSASASTVTVYVWKNAYDVTTVGSAVVGTPI
jgi:hypothetical protein